MKNISFLNKKIGVLKKYGMQCGMTDFAALLGCYQSGFYEEIDGLRESGCYYTNNISSSAGTISYVFCLNSAGELYHSFITRRNVGIRPTFPWLLISQNNNIMQTNSCGVQEIEYGEYPQMVVSSEYAQKLENAFNKGILNKTGKEYTTDSINVDDEDSAFVPRKFTEYEFNKGKYIRFVVDKNSNAKLSSYKKLTFAGEIYWIKVEPIKWLIDPKANVVLSKYILCSGIQFSNNKYFDGKIEKSEIYDFLNNIFGEEIEVYPMKLNNDNFNKQDNNVNNGLNEKSKKVNGIVKEIYSLLDTYYGEEDIVSKVKSLIDKYNNDIKDIFDNKSNKRLFLTTNNMDKEYLFAKLVSDLEEILSMLKISNNNYKEYALMIEYIKEVFNILKNGNSDINKDDLLNDIVTAKTVILTFLEDDRFLTELTGLFKNEQDKIMSYLKDVNVVLEYKTLDEFILYMRSKLQPFLINLDNAVRNKDIINEIEENYKKVIEGLFIKSKNDYVNYFFEQMQIIIDRINVDGNYEDKEKLDKLLHKNVIIEDTAINSLNNIVNLYKSIYGIYLNITDRKKQSDELDNDTILL